MSEQVNIASSIIICPNCAAQFQVAPQIIGISGRKVRCANCQNDWQAMIEDAPEQILQTIKSEESPEANSQTSSQQASDTIPQADEAQLDADFEVLEKKNSLLQSSVKDTLEKVTNIKGNKNISSNATFAKRRADMARRKNMINRSMPRARMRRMVRIAGIILLALVISASLIFRENIVRNFPDTAGLYDSIGLGVNVVGLEFSEVKTLKSLNDNVEILNISAGIVSVSSGEVMVPRVVVSLLDEAGNSLFDWSVTPRASIMLPGEWIEFKTQLSAPPQGVQTVRLTFENTK